MKRILLKKIFGFIDQYLLTEISLPTDMKKVTFYIRNWLNWSLKSIILLLVRIKSIGYE